MDSKDLLPKAAENFKYPIPVSADTFLSEITKLDQEAFLEHMKCRQISLNTLRIPYPYLPSDAEWWTDQKEQETQRNSRPVTFAIREASGRLIGVCGLDGITVGEDYKAEIGYWLAEEYWGKGIVTEVVQTVVALGFTELSLEKITAHAFVPNIGSQRVLEKCGFQREGYFRQHFKKDGTLIDLHFFARLKADWLTESAAANPIERK